MLWNTILLALREIKRNVMRSFLTILGIVIGVGAVITMVTIGGGATAQVKEQIASMGSNLLMVTPGKRLGPGQSSNTVLFKASDGEAIARDVSSVAAVAPVSSQSYQGHIRQSKLVDPGNRKRQPVFQSDEQIHQVGPTIQRQRAAQPAQRSASWGRRCARNCSAGKRLWGKRFASKNSRAR